MPAVRSPHRPLLPDTVGPEHQQPTCLRGRAHNAHADTRPRGRELSRCLAAALVPDGWPALHQEAARGVAHVIADAYAATLHGHLEAWVQRLQPKRSRAPLGRRCAMPQAPGTARPCGRPALDDPLGPLAGAKLYTAIYEQDWRDCRDGERAGRGALEAVRALPCARQDGRYGSRVAADMQGGCAPMAQTGRLDMGRERIDARALLHLRCPWLTAGILDTDGQVVHPETGTPHGGTGSPVLAPVSLPDALARGGETVGKPRGRGAALWCR